MFGRATIRLGIGPYSSLLLLLAMAAGNQIRETVESRVQRPNCRTIELPNCAVKAKFHYAIQLANQRASWFASWFATC